MKKKWLVLIGALLLFSITFANKSVGRCSIDPDEKIDKVRIDKVRIDKVRIDKVRIDKVDKK